jgi:hypothetical protein
MTPGPSPGVGATGLEPVTPSVSKCSTGFPPTSRVSRGGVSLGKTRGSGSVAVHPFRHCPGCWLQNGYSGYRRAWPHGHPQAVLTVGARGTPGAPQGRPAGPRRPPPVCGSGTRPRARQGPCRLSPRHAPRKWTRDRPAPRLPRWEGSGSPSRPGTRQRAAGSWEWANKQAGEFGTPRPFALRVGLGLVPILDSLRTPRRIDWPDAARTGWPNGTSGAHGS